MSLLLPEFEAPGELFCPEMDTELANFIAATLDLARRYPALVEAVHEDQERQARGGKAKRLADHRWLAQRTALLPGWAAEWSATPKREAATLTLGVGRPRLPAEVCFVFLALRGYFGSVTDREAVERIRESLTIRRYLARRNLVMPSAHTILDHLNGVSNATRERILAAQLGCARAEALDDLQMAIVDSTAVEANSAWPTDSELLHKLVRSTFRLGKKLSDFGVPAFRDWRFADWINRLHQLAFQISLVGGKKGADHKRRQYYRQLYRTAEQAVRKLDGECTRVAAAVAAAALRPSGRERLDEVWSNIQAGVAASRRVIAYSRRRVLGGEKIEAATKILSVSDAAAALIVKGQRDPVLGYKPQVVRSEQGLITGLLTPSGNAADSACLLPALAEHCRNAGVTAVRISCDDGYASRDNYVELLKQEGVKQVSFSGSKGKAVIPEADWLSADYQFLRHKRSAVEGCIFMLKYLFDFGRVRRRGLDPVRAELLEKAIAYNFWRLQFLRQKRRGQQAA